MILRRSTKSTTKAPEFVPTVPRREKLTSEQITQRRYEDWRIAHDVGLPDASGVIRRRPVSLIAALYGVSRQAVYEGIHSARLTQNAIARIVADAE